MHLSDVVLQVEGRGEVSLAVVPRADQHRLVGRVDPFVPLQSVAVPERLLARLAGEGGFRARRGEEKQNPNRTLEKVHGTAWRQFCRLRHSTQVPGCLSMCFWSLLQVYSSAWQLARGQR